MSSDQQATACPSLTAIKRGIAKGTLTEIFYPRRELKSKWSTDRGKNISAIANHESLTAGWIFVGVDDDGKLTGKDEVWCKKSYEKIGNQINEFLNPTQVVKEIHTASFDGIFCILLEIQNPAYVTDWMEQGYKQAGSSISLGTSKQTKLALGQGGEGYTQRLETARIAHPRGQFLSCRLMSASSSTLS